MGCTQAAASGGVCTPLIIAFKLFQGWSAGLCVKFLLLQDSQGGSKLARSTKTQHSQVPIGEHDKTGSPWFSAVSLKSD